MKSRTPWWRYALVVGTVLVGAGMVGIGWLGSPRHPEKIRSLQVTIMPAGENGVRVREVIDQDFGSSTHHGPEVVLPDDFGRPAFVQASSKDAPADVNLAVVVNGYRIRIGNPDKKIVTGLHRYVLEYTLPDARLSTGRLAVDAINPGDVDVDHFEVDVVGLTLSNPGCKYGPLGSTTDCELSDAGTGYRARIAHLDKTDAVTVSGTITGRSSIEVPPEPASPSHPSDDRSPYVLAALLLGTVSSVAVFLWARRAGSNEVAGGGAADAAFSGPPPPGTATRLVSDHDLAQMSTVEFAPPTGIEPWQGGLVLREQVDVDAQTAWFSGAAAHGYLDINGSGSGETTSLTPGSKRSEADDFSARILDSLFSGRDSVHLGSYDSRFATVWEQVANAQVAWAAGSGWWRSHPPTRGGSAKQPGGCAGTVALVVLLVLLVPFYLLAGAILGVVPLLWPAGLLLVGVVMPALIARAAAGWMLASRTAAGSAYALRTESFRRFLVESEGQHVQWAWEHDLVRQYSAWAVALGAADAWRKAMESSGIPREEIEWSQTVLNRSMASTFASSSTAPSTSSSSSSFSSGGFSGGSSGGGGGGGSHGSW